MENDFFEYVGTLSSVVAMLCPIREMRTQLRTLRILPPSFFTDSDSGALDGVACLSDTSCLSHELRCK